MSSVHRIFLATGLLADRSLSFPDLLRSFLRQTAEREGTDVIGATCHRGFDKLVRVWPSARFIHILRDPRDVALSCIQMGWAGNVWFAVDRWIEAEESWDRLARNVDPERILEIRYEQLVAAPATTLRSICDFVGVVYEPRMLEYSVTSTYSKPDPSLLYQWKRKANPEQLGMLEYKIGTLLKDRGYAPSGVAAGAPASLAWLRLHNKLYRTRYRLNTFGIGRVALDFLHRHIGLGSVGIGSPSSLSITRRLS
jgi:Sulfotransferase family